MDRDTATESPQAAGAGAEPGYRLTTGTLVAAAVAVAVAQIGLSWPAVLNGLFQLDLNTTSTQLTWISDAFLVPVTLFELSFGVIGDMFGRKRLRCSPPARIPSRHARTPSRSGPPR